MIIDGKAVSEKRIDELLKERAQFGALTLSIVVTNEDAVTSSYLRIKSRVAERLAIVTELLSSLADARGDGVVLQLPLPSHVDTDIERNKIPLFGDVDVLSDAAYQKFVDGDFPPPPVPRAMEYLLNEYNVPVSGKVVVVIGQGRLVGKPAAELFRQRGALVTALQKGDDIFAHTRGADIIVLGAGEPNLLKPDMIKDGVVILDAGTSEAGGVVVGDADPRCAEKASLFTPVPRGIGPIAVVEIFANLFELKRLQSKN